MRTIVVDGMGSVIGGAVASAARERGDGVYAWPEHKASSADDDKFTLLCCRGTFNTHVEESLRVNLIEPVAKAHTALSMGFGAVIFFAGGGVGGEIKADGPPVAYQVAKAGLCVAAERLALMFPKACVYVISPGQIASRLTGGIGGTPDHVAKLVMWLTAEPRPWLSGRIIAARFETPEMLETISKFGQPVLGPDDLRLRRALPWPVENKT